MKKNPELQKLDGALLISVLCYDCWYHEGMPQGTTYDHGKTYPCSFCGSSRTAVELLPRRQDGLAKG